MSDVFYESSRYGRLRVADMAIPHARRALAALGEDAFPELRAALAARAALDGTTVDTSAVPFGDPAGAMLRGTTGTFVGAIHPSAYRRPEPEPAPVVEAERVPEPKRQPWRLLVAVVAVATFWRRRRRP